MGQSDDAPCAAQGQHEAAARPPGSQAALPAPKLMMPFGPGPSSLAAASSQRDTLMTGPTRLMGLMEPGEGSGEKDEYLMRLLQRGAPQRPGQGSSGFRAPDPVLRSGSGPVVTGLNALASMGVRAPAPAPAAPAAAEAAPAAAAAAAAAKASPGPKPQAPRPVSAALLRPPSAPRPGSAQRGSGNAPEAPLAISATFGATRQRLGDEVAFNIRDTIIRQQVMFLEQLYDLHRALAIQKLLLQHCPEMHQVMGEAMKLMSSVGSLNGSGSRHGNKRQRTVPDSGSGQPSTLRPDSQFAAVPQGVDDSQTAGGSDHGSGNGSGSGAHGSGGGSTSPQPGAAFLAAFPPTLPPAARVPHAAHAAPSGASAAPMPALNGYYMQQAAPAGAAWWQAPQSATPAQHPGPGPSPSSVAQPGGLDAAAAAAAAIQQQAQVSQMAPWVGQNAGLAAAGLLQPPAKHPHGAAPAPAAMAAPDPMAWWYNNYYGRMHQQQHSMPSGNGPLMPGGSPAMGGLAAAMGEAPKWWHDPRQTFGPAADPDVVARAAEAAEAKRGCEAESAPVSQGHRAGGFGQRRCIYSDSHLHLKRKAAAAADADEASSGTTGHDYGAAQEQDTGTQTVSMKRARRSLSVQAAAREGQANTPRTAATDANVAELLLQISNSKQ